MYYCKNCGSTFCEPKTERESHGLDYGFEEFEACPCCGVPGMFYSYSEDEDEVEDE